MNTVSLRLVVARDGSDNGDGKAVGMTIERQGDGNSLYLDYSNDNSLLVTLYYRFARCCHWGKLGQEYKCSLHNFLQLHVNQNYLKKIMG